MFLTEVDKANNLVRVTFAGRVTPEELQERENEIRRMAEDLVSGFRLLTDLSRLESMDLACAPFIERSMDIYNAKGIAKVVRIIPDPRKDIGLSIMSMFHYGRGVRIVTCETLEEAERALLD